MLLRELFNIEPRIPISNNSKYLINNKIAVGVEVELENVRRSLSRNGSVPGWRVTEDGSLRDGGMEFILSSPQRGTRLVQSLKALNSRVRNIIEHRGTDTGITSPRTSVHVHVNILEESINTIFNIVALYLVFEKTLFRIAGGNREGNIFCLPYTKTEDYQHIDLLNRARIYDTIPDSCPEPKDKHIAVALNRLDSDDNKYAALALSTIPRLGSIEFRHYPGTYDWREIVHWINIILQLVTSAKGLKYPIEEVPQEVSEKGVYEFSQQIWGDLYQVVSPYISRADIYEGSRALQDILYNWEETGIEREEKQNAGEEIGTMARNFLKRRGVEIKVKPRPETDETLGIF